MVGPQSKLYSLAEHTYYTSAKHTEQSPTNKIQHGDQMHTAHNDNQTMVGTTNLNKNTAKHMLIQKHSYPSDMIFVKTFTQPKFSGPKFYTQARKS